MEPAKLLSSPLHGFFPNAMVFRADNKGILSQVVLVIYFSTLKHVEARSAYLEIPVEKRIAVHSGHDGSGAVFLTDNSDDSFNPLTTFCNNKIREISFTSSSDKTVIGSCVTSISKKVQDTNIGITNAHENDIFGISDPKQHGEYIIHLR